MSEKDYNRSTNHSKEVPMKLKVEELKKAIANGTYDWKSAIETCAEKIILLHSLGMF